MIICLIVKENVKCFVSVIQVLQVCEVVCIYCVMECGKNGYVEVMVCCIGVCMDCVEYCVFMCKFLECNSEFVDLFFEDCVEICF